MGATSMTLEQLAHSGRRPKSTATTPDFRISESTTAGYGWAIDGGRVDGWVNNGAWLDGDSSANHYLQVYVR